MLSTAILSDWKCQGARRGWSVSAHQCSALKARAHIASQIAMYHRSTENGVLQVGASQYMAALIIGFVNSATIQVNLSHLSHHLDYCLHHMVALCALPSIRQAGRRNLRRSTFTL